MMRLSEAAAALGARIPDADVTVTGVSTDSRVLNPGDLFVALRGERFDGHAFVPQAAAADAAAALVDAAYVPGAAALPLLVVADTRAALGRLAAHWRARFHCPVVALTGSSGKTTVKEMLAAILHEAAQPGGAAEAHVLATRGNLNNDIGVPLMLLELRATHRYAVIEMGMNHEGEIRYLSRLAAPDVAVVTNAGSAHIAFLGSEERIARAKGEIFESLTADGTAVVNADDAYADLWRSLCEGKRRIEFGLGAWADVTATYELRPLESEIVVTMPKGTASARLHAPGLHNVRNALAAAAAAAALEIPASAVGAGLTRFKGVKGRLQMKPARHDALLIDDTYNANPESARAAIDVLAKAAGEKILVLGDMGELGADAPRLHAELGTYAKAAGIDRMLALGEHSAGAAAAFGRGAHHYARIEELLADLENALAPEVTVLVKGSRFMHMERVIEAFARERAACS